MHGLGFRFYEHPAAHLHVERVAEPLAIEPVNAWAVCCECHGCGGHWTDLHCDTIVAETEAVSHIVNVIKVGNANVYCLDPKEVWKSFDNAKPYAAFNTKTLVGKTENPYVKRRLATLLNGEAPEQKDWLNDLDVEEDVEASIQMAAE